MKHVTSNFNFILILAFIVGAIPILHLPFTWITVFFHEISHGLAALFTGGSIVKIHLNILGSGLCYTSGGSRFLILQSGYIGASLWGVIFYSMSDAVKVKNIRGVVYFILSLLAITLLLWGRDLMTWIILTTLFVAFWSLIKLQGKEFVKFLLRFTGIYIVLDAIKSPLYLIDGRHYGDGSKLADLTSIPELIWVIIWFSVGLLAAYFLWKCHNPSDFSSEDNQEMT